MKTTIGVRKDTKDLFDEAKFNWGKIIGVWKPSDDDFIKRLLAEWEMKR